MKSIRSILLLLAFSAAASLHAEEGWRELFNGRDRTGWKANAYPASWSVVDGTIRTQATKESSHLFYVGDGKEDFVRFKNFELEIVVRGEPEANSGVFIHTDLANYASALRHGLLDFIAAGRGRKNPIIYWNETAPRSSPKP